MTPQRWQRIEELFRTVAERPLVERESYLTSACADDEDLRREVLELLAHQTAESFLDNPIKPAAHAVTDAPASEFIGQRVGPYRLTRLIGRGGMGTVYEAVRDDDEFQQQVAIKLIKHGMDSAFVRERFLRERQILASLDHPHIARLLDGGVTDDGQSYIVMELLQGEPLTDFAKRRDLDLRATVRLVLPVCAAVAHAHSRLVVHADIKPSNVIVTANGQVRLLDFGVARVLEAAKAGDAGETGTTPIGLTQEYASPARRRNEPATTVDDVYSLGVLIEELLRRFPDAIISVPGHAYAGFTSIDGRYLVEEISQNFEFPGMKIGPATLHQRRSHSSFIGPIRPQFYCCNGDKDAFKAYADRTRQCSVARA